MSLAGDERGVDWAQQYEALRAHAVGEAPVGFVPLGLGVLYRRGVAGWMVVEWRAGVEGDRQEEGRREGTEQQRRAGELSPAMVELVQVLATAALTLSQRRVS